MHPACTPVPVEADFLDPRSQDPDERHALRMFLGKSAEQAAEMFQEKFTFYQEDLVYMGRNALRYYLPPALAYVCSSRADGDSDAVNMLYGVLKLRHGDIVAIPALAATVADAIRCILSDFGRFRCNPEIYGDLPSRYRQTLTGLDA